MRKGEDAGRASQASVGCASVLLRPETFFPLAQQLEDSVQKPVPNAKRQRNQDDPKWRRSLFQNGRSRGRARLLPSRRYGRD